MTEDHSHAGQGAVLLDIGDGVGAVVIEMPAELIGREVEARPLVERAVVHSHAVHLPHVAVMTRPTPVGPVHSAVFAELAAGEYEFYLRPSGPVRVRAEVIGGQAQFATWPLDQPTAEERADTFA